MAGVTMQDIMNDIECVISKEMQIKIILTSKIGVRIICLQGKLSLILNKVKITAFCAFTKCTGTLKAYFGHQSAKSNVIILTINAAQFRTAFPFRRQIKRPNPLSKNRVSFLLMPSSYHPPQFRVVVLYIKFITVLGAFQSQPCPTTGETPLAY